MTTILLNFRATFIFCALAFLTLVYGVTGDIALNLSLGGNAGIFFRLAQLPEITSITRFNSNVELDWNTLPDETYRVEYKTSLTSENWNPLDPDITSTTNTSSFMDNTASDEERYYRVRLLP